MLWRFFHFMDFVLTRGYTVCYATHQTWLQSQAWTTLVAFLPTYPAYSHSAYTACQLSEKSQLRLYCNASFPLPCKRQYVSWIKFGQKFLWYVAKSSGSLSCVQKRQCGPINHWVLKRSQGSNSSFWWSYRNALFITHLCFYELQQAEHRER